MLAREHTPERADVLLDATFYRLRDAGPTSMPTNATHDTYNPYHLPPPARPTLPSSSCRIAAVRIIWVPNVCWVQPTA